MVDLFASCRPPKHSSRHTHFSFFFLNRRNHTDLLRVVWRVFHVLQVWPLKLSVVFPRRTRFVGGGFWGVFGTETSYDQIWAETVGFILCKRVVFEQVFVEFVVLELLWDLARTPQNVGTVYLESFEFQDQVLKKSKSLKNVLKASISSLFSFQLLSPEAHLFCTSKQK